MRKSAIESSAYGAEFIAKRTATEEIKVLRYTLRSFGVPVTKTSFMYGDNLGMLQYCTIPDGILKKKHCTISYHICREIVADGIIAPHKVAISISRSDACTKTHFVRYCV